MTNLVDHARRELATINEDPETRDGLLKVVEAFAELNKNVQVTHETIQTLNSLLEFQHLAPLTDDPEEWFKHEEYLEDGTSLWQNKRNGGAFSHDGGKTHYLLEEGASDKNRSPMHDSMDHRVLLAGAEGVID